MHQIKATADYPPLGLQKGQVYYMNDVTAAVILANEVGTAMHVGPSVSPPGAESVLLIRMGAFGDLLQMRPAIAALVATGKRVGVACLANYRDALAGLDVEWVPYPVSREDWYRWTAKENLENVVEKGEEARHVDMASLWAQRLGVKVRNFEVGYPLSEERRAWAEALYPRTGSKRVAVQMRASVAHRTWPVEDRLAPTVRAMLKKGWQVLLLDVPGSSVIDWQHPNLVPVMQDKRVQTFADTAAILETCDGVAGPDSALTHLAGALGIRGIALYGPFPGRLRVNHAKSLKVIEGKAPCAPCFFHVTPMSGPFPKGMPCAKARACVALLEISPERVVHQLEDWMKKEKR